MFPSLSEDNWEVWPGFTGSLSRRATSASGWVPCGLFGGLGVGEFVSAGSGVDAGGGLESGLGGGGGGFRAGVK